MQTSPPHIYPVRIVPGDIDFMGHVNNASYLKWVQEAVLSHWWRIAPPEAIGAHLWVALRHEITYRRPAFIEDRLIATVAIEKIHGASAFYDTAIRRGGELLTEVKSRWCCLDAATLRPTRLAPEVIELLAPDRITADTRQCAR